jgi:hypothetical protein
LENLQQSESPFNLTAPTTPTPSSPTWAFERAAANMSTPKYLTGDKAAIKAFLDKFDV